MGWISGTATAQSTQAGSFQGKNKTKQKPQENQSGGKTPLLKVTGFAAREGVSEEQGAELMVEDEGWGRGVEVTDQESCFF